MKPSPLQLEWLTYPAVSFKANEPSESMKSICPAEIDARISYELDGKHGAELDIRSQDDQGTQYDFTLEAVASFTIDIELLRQMNSNVGESKLPKLVGVTVARLIYSSAREYLAMLTARAPYGAIMLEANFIGPEDVKVGSATPRDDILAKVFHIEKPVSANKFEKPVIKQSRSKRANKKPESG